MTNVENGENFYIGQEIGMKMLGVEVMGSESSTLILFEFGSGIGFQLGALNHE